MKKTLLPLTFVVLFSCLAAGMLPSSAYEKAKNNAREHFIGVVQSVRPIMIWGCSVDMVADVEVTEVFKTRKGIAPGDRVRLLYYSVGPMSCTGPTWHSHLERGYRIEVHANSFAEYLSWEYSEEERLARRAADFEIAGSGIDVLEKGVLPPDPSWILFLLLVIVVVSLIRARRVEKSELFTKDASGSKATEPFVVWVLILVLTLLTAIVVLFNVSAYTYYGTAKTFMTSSLFFGLSAALFLGLKRGDRKLLLWTGLLEFVILLLSLLSFDMSQDYLFYFLVPLFVLMPFFVVVFGVLWVSLPVGLFYVQENAEDRKKLWMFLVMLALVVGIIWTVVETSGFNRWDWATQRYVLDLGRFALGWSLIFLVPLGIWTYVERRLSAPSKAKKP